MVKKLKPLPGNVKITPRLRRLQNTNWLQFLKEYQEQMVQN